jgi:site-specific DNA-methyltransferase (adenine-specific)
VILHQGDCIEIMQQIPSGTVDMVLTDPPYGTTECSWDNPITFPEMWEQLQRITKPNAAIVLMAAQPFASQLICSNERDFRYDLIWEKGNATGFFNAKKMPLRAHEHILVFYRKLPAYNPQMTHGHKRKTATKKVVESECYGKDISMPSYDSTSRYPRSVQFFSSDKQRGNFHPTQKPAELMRYLIKTFSNPGDTVLDFTMGSGTTGVACIQTDREFIGIELDAKHYRTAAKRIKHYLMPSDDDWVVGA